MVDRLAVAEADFRLGGMDIDIDLVGWQLDEQERHGVPSRHEQTAVSFLEGMAEAAIANPAAVDEQVLQLGVAAFTGRVRHIAAKLRRYGLHFDDVEPVAHFRAEEQADTAQ